MIKIEPISFNLWKNDKEAFAEKFGESFRETGFAVISDHTVSDKIIEDADEAGKRLFRPAGRRKTSVC